MEARLAGALGAVRKGREVLEGAPAGVAAEQPLAEAAAKSKRAAFDLQSRGRGDRRARIGVTARPRGNRESMRHIAIMLALGGSLWVPAFADTQPAGIAGTVVDAKSGAAHRRGRTLYYYRAPYSRRRRT